jgi:integration host factor subunit alpha
VEIRKALKRKKASLLFFPFGQRYCIAYPFLMPNFKESYRMPKAQKSDAFYQNTLTRAELADAIHDRLGLSRAESAQFVEKVVEGLLSGLEQGHDVKISSFGTFRLLNKAERIGRNPKSGIEAKISARRVVSFHPSNKLRQRMNGSVAS